MSEKDYAEVFGRRLRFYLELHDMSQKELADRLGVSNAAVSTWINGVKTPRMDKVDDMCKLFGCRRSDFLEDTNTTGYYMDPETAKLAQELFEDKELRVLFNAARDSKPEDLQMAADLLRRLKGTNPNG